MHHPIVIGFTIIVKLLQKQFHIQYLYLNLWQYFGLIEESCVYFIGHNLCLVSCSHDSTTNSELFDKKVKTNK